jgi:hypothetical protein
MNECLIEQSPKTTLRLKGDYGHHNHEQNFIDGITCSGTLMAAETETIL